MNLLPFRHHIAMQGADSASHFFTQFVRGDVDRFGIANVLFDYSQLSSTPCISEFKDLYFNGESIRLFHEPDAHTDDDTMVYFRRSDVLSTGDVYNTNTLEQVRAAKPTIDYDPRYGATTGFWTTDRFVEVVYNDLKAGA